MPRTCALVSSDGLVSPGRVPQPRFLFVFGPLLPELGRPQGAQVGKQVGLDARPSFSLELVTNLACGQESMQSVSGGASFTLTEQRLLCLRCE